ncbi:MAG TPA: 50S ribosomal protein L6 [Candidatus Dojkabacteria bacterium]|nr:50S ribosomal protein L6 [Candidatus Dojkabacteria bacterium]
MSKIGYNPITIENGVQVTIENSLVTAKGPKGELKVQLPKGISIEQKDNQLLVKRADEEKQTKSFHGTFRSLVANIIEGVSKGFSKKLEVSGVGYRVRKEGNDLVMNLGWTHPVKVVAPEGITIDAPDEVTIIVSGIDKQYVGEIAAKIREMKKTEPYKGKGIKYENEVVRRKSAKSATSK